MAETRKSGSFRSNARAGRMAERDAPLPSLEDRFRALDRIQGLQEVSDTEPQVIEKVVEKLVAVPERIQLEEILDRTTNIRGVSEIRAQKFASSIAVVGLIQPIAIDKNGRLLAGDHRRRALHILWELSQDPSKLEDLMPDVDQDVASKALDAWERLGFAEGVPVHRMDLDGEEEPELAKAIELAENTNREDFTKDEVKKAWEQLRDAGYRDVVGRPKIGEKPMRPELALIFGKSLRTITTYLQDFRAEESGESNPKADVDPWKESVEKELYNVFQASRVQWKKSGSGEIRLRFQNKEELESLMKRIQTLSQN